MQRGKHALLALHQAGFRDFQLDGFQGYAAGQGTQAYVVHQVGPLKEPTGQIDRNGVAEAESIPPGTQLPGGFAQGPLRHGQDQADLLGQRDEVHRRQEPPRPLPAHQGFGSHHAALLHIHLGLVVQHQFLPLQGLVERRFDFQAFTTGGCQVGRIHRSGVAP